MKIVRKFAKNSQKFAPLSSLNRFNPPPDPKDPIDPKGPIDLKGSIESL